MSDLDTLKIQLLSSTLLYFFIVVWSCTYANYCVIGVFMVTAVSTESKNRGGYHTETAAKENSVGAIYS